MDSENNMVESMEETPRLQGIAQMLVLQGLLGEKAASQAYDAAKKEEMPVVEYLVSKKILAARDIAQVASKDFGVPLFDLDCFDKEMIPFDLVSEKLIQRHQVIPLFKRGERLFIAMSDPSRQIALDEIKFQTGINTYSVVVEADKLEKFIEATLSAKESEAMDEFLDDSELDNLEFSSADETQQDDDADSATDDAPIVRFVNKILLDAIHKTASDIHFEPYEKMCRVRFRIDGVLYEIANPPLNLSNRIASRLKIMSLLDISERRVPQDGRFKMNLSRNHVIDFRVSTCPTVNGEKIVMRVLDPTSATLGIEHLGFNKKQRDMFNSAIQQPQGMILVTGPTGSGKTVTLYTALNILNTTERNISTAEDPVEIKLTGVNQVNINNKAGLTFSRALRSFLRQDPDIIMVGEMRDLETAEIGIKAAQTGHLVLSTLHTNSSPETLTRLVNMGIPTFNIANTVSLIIAQRLARRLCENCKQVDKIPDEALVAAGFCDADIGNVELYKANGCDQCTNGYKGRVGLYETLQVTKSIGESIMNGSNSMEIERQAIEEGMTTVRISGIEKVKAGITGLEEVNRVTKD